MRSVIAVGAGLLLSAASEPVALPWLLPLGVAGYVVAVRGLGSRRAGLVGLLFGIAFYYTHIAWMRTSIGPDAWVALAGIEAAFYGLLGLCTPFLQRRSPVWSAVWFAAAWTTMETVRSGWPFSGMPWGRLSFAVVDTPVAPAVAYLSMTGLSFGLALLGALLVHALPLPAGAGRTVGPEEAGSSERAVWRPRNVVPLLATAAALLLPALAPFTPRDDGSLRVSVVQGDVPGPGNDILYDSFGVTRNHVDATVGLGRAVDAGEEQRPDLVVWPENSTATDPFEQGPVRRGIERAVEAVRAPVMVGAIVDDGPEHILNQGIVWDPVTGPGERYTKHHPVPYGEYIPYRDVFNPQFGKLKLISRDQRSGTRSTPLRVAGTRVADAICFDVAYDDVLPPQVRSGARLLVVQTSNASFIFTHQVEQQFAITRLRAIEAGRWLAVASTNGRTGVISPDGEVVASVEPRTTAVLTEEVGLSSSLTPAMWMGPWPSRLFIAMFLGALVSGVVAYRRRSECAGPTQGDTAAGAVVPPVPTTTPDEAHHV